MAQFLQSARNKLARANKHIADLDREVMTFLNTNPYAIVQEPDAQGRPNHVTHKIKLVRDLPPDLPEIVGDAAVNLRAALDRAGFEIAVAAGKTNPRNTYFPIYQSEIEFEKSARGLCKDIPDEIFAFIRELKPYKGANDFLYALNRIAVADKHTIVTAMSASAIQTAGKFSSTGFFECPQRAIWDREKREFIIGTFAQTVQDSTFEYQFDFFSFVAFGDVEVVSGKPVVPVFNKIAGIVEGILGGLEAESKRLGIMH